MRQSVLVVGGNGKGGYSLRAARKQKWEEARDKTPFKAHTPATCFLQPGVISQRISSAATRFAICQWSQNPYVLVTSGWLYSFASDQAFKHRAHNYFPQNYVFTSLGRKLEKVGSLPHLLLLILTQEQKHKVVKIVWHHHHCQKIMIHNQRISNKSCLEVTLGLHRPSLRGHGVQWWVVVAAWIETLEGFHTDKNISSN